MDAHLSEPGLRRGGDGGGPIGGIGLLLIIWALCSVAGPRSAPTELVDTHDIAPTATAVVAWPSTAARPHLAAPCVLPPLLVAADTVRWVPACLPASAERRDPPPSLFHRVSYRTTAPPPANG